MDHPALIKKTYICPFSLFDTTHTAQNNPNKQDPSPNIESHDPTTQLNE